MWHFRGGGSPERVGEVEALGFRLEWQDDSTLHTDHTLDLQEHCLIVLQSEAWPTPKRNIPKRSFSCSLSKGFPQRQQTHESTADNSKRSSICKSCVWRCNAATQILQNMEKRQNLPSLQSKHEDVDKELCQCKYANKC